MLPLEGYRVLDFGWVMAGPITGHLLADMGAEVIKVESRRRIDASRRGRPITGEKIAQGDAGEQPDLVPLFHNLNRNKLSITVDFSHPQAQGLLRKLACQCDVVLENFTPHVLRSVGLDYQSLRRVRPDIVMVSLYAAGATGPLRDISTYAPSIGALSSLDSMVGYQGEPLLGTLSLNFADSTGGLYGAIAILAALRHRAHTGQGQYVDISQWESVITLLGEPIMDYVMNGRVAGPCGFSHPTMAPHGNYPCKEADTWVSIAVGSEDEWRAFCRAIGKPSWTIDPRFADMVSRLEHRRELDEHVASWTRTTDAYEAMGMLQAAGVASMPVLGVEGRYANPHYQTRDMFVDVPHPLIGSELVYGLAWKLSSTPGALRRHAPLVGEHNAYILHEVIGLPLDEIEALTQQQVAY